MKRAVKRILLITCLSVGQQGTAQEQKAEKWRPEVGLELTSELQGANAGDFRSATSGEACLSWNYVNLLRLNAALPIIYSKNEGVRTNKLTFEIASLSTCMTAKESIGGDLQTFSNLDAGNIPFALSVLDVNWHVNDRHSLSFGIRNMNEDYFTSPVTSFFTNSSCGIFPTISVNYPIANYPVASVGLHYCYDGSPIKVQASLYNGTGYNRFAGRDNVFRICPQSDGVFGLAEVEYQHKGSSYFLGACTRYDKEVHHQLASTLWTYTEQRLTNQVALIAAYSHAFSGAECSDFVGVGGKYTRREWELGLFADMARFGNTTEFATEMSGKYSFSSHFYVQPSVHAIVTGRTFHAVACLRFEVAL